MTTTRVALIALSSVAGCTSDAGTAQVTTDPMWVLPFPASLQVSWAKLVPSCWTDDGGCEDPVSFRIVAAHCDNCEVYVPSLPTSTYDGGTTLTARAHDAGPVAFTADLEADDGEQQTVHISAYGDRPTALVLDCRDSGQPCGVVRTPDGRLEIGVRVETVVQGLVSLMSIVPDDDPSAFSTLLPVMSPDAASWDGDTIALAPGTPATLETVTWVVGDATLAASIAIPP